MGVLESLACFNLASASINVALHFSYSLAVTSFSLPNYDNLRTKAKTTGRDFISHRDLEWPHGIYDPIAIDINSIPVRVIPKKHFKVTGWDKQHGHSIFTRSSFTDFRSINIMPHSCNLKCSNPFFSKTQTTGPQFVDTNCWIRGSQNRNHIHMRSIKTRVKTETFTRYLNFFFFKILNDLILDPSSRYPQTTPSLIWQEGKTWFLRRVWQNY